VPEVAAALKLNQQTVRKWIQAKSLLAVQARLAIASARSSASRNACAMHCLVTGSTTSAVSLTSAQPGLTAG